MIGWSGFACVVALQVQADMAWRGLASTLAASLLLILGALAAWLFGSLPSSLSLSAATMLFAVIVLLLAGAAAHRAPDPEALFAAFCWAWLVAGVASALVALVQVFMPEWADGDWISRSGLPGRAVGNMRQPNHLSSALLWACTAAVALVELRRLQRMLGFLLMALLVFALVLSASRTGLVGIAFLALWGLLDRRRSPTARAMLMGTAAVYALSWWAMALWAHGGHHTFGGEARLSESDISGSRYGIWSNTLEMIRQQPWTGVGFGEFNFAWTLTPFPHRPTAFFDHTHNLPLQLVVELGWPLGLLILGLLAHALWRAWQAGAVGSGPRQTTTRCAFMMVLMMVLHSLLEYPLWYAYFLLPTAWALGYALAQPDAGQHASQGAPAQRARPWLAIASLVVMLGSALSILDYLRVVTIFSPSEDAAPLAQRIAGGQRSILFSHHADYAAATTAEHPGEVMEAFAGATHYLLDTRLMIAWARAFAERGDLDRASYVAQRLREFNKPDAAEFFAPCDDPAQSSAAFQCHAPKRVLTWRDFAQR
jgi:O-antigen ligase